MSSFWNTHEWKESLRSGENVLKRRKKMKLHSSKLDESEKRKTLFQNT
jgi:hypothetical protein